MPSLILLDRHLPDRDAEEVVAELRARPETHAIPVVIMTPDEAPADIQPLLAAGASGWLLKPFDATALLDVVDGHVSNPAPPAAGGRGDMLDGERLLDDGVLATAAVEALVRWEHPERGRMAPGKFIARAEEFGLIEELGAWVLERACRDAAGWQQAFPLRPPLVMAVNVSASQLNPQLGEVVERVLAGTGLEPSQLRLEMTESSVMNDIGVAIATLGDLKARGLMLSVDDFGTGYSSLSYLQRLPVDEVKVDRSFVVSLGSDDGDSAIVAAIVSLASALDLDVVAEGVETTEQLDALRHLGRDYAQGYFFARPQPASSLVEILTDAAGGDRLPARPATSRSASSASRMETILIADDAADVLQLASMSLTTAGFTVHGTQSGAEAIELASRVTPDCVVLDIGMHDVSGLDVCRSLRANPATSDCVILMLTARSTPGDKIDAFALGADDYIVKPFSPRELVGRVQSALRRRDQLGGSRT